MGGEPAIYIDTNGVFVATRYKRVMCKKVSGALKTVKELEAITTTLLPDAPLKSIAFAGNNPPEVNCYNTFLAAGAGTAIKELPETVGRTGKTVDGALPPALLVNSRHPVMVMVVVVCASTTL